MAIQLVVLPLGMRGVHYETVSLQGFTPIATSGELVINGLRGEQRDHAPARISTDRQPFA